MAPNRHGLGSRRATRPGSWPPTYLSYDDPAPRVRPATARIWRDCGRRMMIWTAVYAVIAAVGLTLYGCGVLLPYLPMS